MCCYIHNILKSFCIIGVNLQKVLPFLLSPVKYTLPSQPYSFSKFNGQIKNAKVAITRVITDTPGAAEFNGTKNHRAGANKILNMVFNFFYNFYLYRKSV